MSAELTVSSSSVCLRVSLISVNWNWRTLWAWRSRSNSWNRTHNQNFSAPAVFDSTRCVLCVTSDLAGDVTVSPWLPQQLLHVAQLLPQSFHLIHQSRLLVVQLSIRNHRLTVLLLHLGQRVLNTHTHTSSLSSSSSSFLKINRCRYSDRVVRIITVLFFCKVIDYLHVSDWRLRLHGERRVTAASARRSSDQRSECGGGESGGRPRTLRRMKRRSRNILI